MQTDPNEHHHDGQGAQDEPGGVSPEVGERGEVQNESEGQHKEPGTPPPTPLKDTWVSRCWQWCRQQWWDSWRFDDSPSIFEALTFFVSALGVYFLIQQFGQTESALREARESNRIARDQTVIENRAWLSLAIEKRFDLIAPLPAAPWEFTYDSGVRVTLTNKGRTPAVMLDGCIRIQALDINGGEAQQPEFGKVGTCDPIHRIDTRVLRSDEDVTFRVFPTADITTDDIVAVPNGTKYIAIYGRVAFRDVFQNPRWVQFCDYFIDATNDPNIVSVDPEQMRPCREYNNMDAQETGSQDR